MVAAEFRRLAIVVALLGAMTSPVAAQSPSSPRAIAAATDSARRWLALLADGNYAASWQQASHYFRERIREDDWETNARHLASQFRRASQRQLVGTSWYEDVPPLPRVEYVVLQWNTDVDRDRHVGERVVMVHDADGAWRAASYELWPNADGDPILLWEPRRTAAPVAPAPRPTFIAAPKGGG